MKSKYKKIIIFLLYIILIIVISCFHENWRDEVQSYLLCRDMNFLELFKNVHYEGHPFFYYLLLYPFVKMGFGIKIVNVLSLVYMIISSYLIIFKSKIKTIYKICIIFSIVFLYDYTIIGRSYSLVVLLVVLIALLWENKKNNAIILGLLIGLLINTHIFMEGFCLLLFVGFYVYELIINRKNNSKEENKKILIGFIIICIFGLILLIQFIPVLLHGISMSINKNFTLINIICRMFAIVLCPFINKYYLLSFLFLICILIFLILLYDENKRLFIFYLLNVFLLSVLSTYVLKKLSMNKALLYVLFIYFICLVNYNKKSNFILIVMFILFIPNVLYFYYYEIKMPYSSAKYAYNYIEKNISKDSIIITMNDPQTSNLAGYNKDYKYYDLKSNRYFTYIVWDEKRENLDIDFKYINKKLSNYKNIYYISLKEDEYNFDKIMREHYNLEELYRDKKSSITQEDYIIYKIQSIKEN